MKKNLLIFGANGALGKGVAETLIKKDYDNVYLFASRFDEKYPGNINLIETTDLSIEENVKKAFENIAPVKEELFFLFNSIGGYMGGKNLWETDSADMDKMISMNLKASYFISKYFAHVVRESKGGSIMHTAAYAGLYPEGGKALYASSKAALITMVKALAIEGKEINLTANAIAPHIIDTPANRGWAVNIDFDTWIKPEETGEFIHGVFNCFHFVSGNIFKLTNRLNLK